MVHTPQETLSKNPAGESRSGGSALLPGLLLLAFLVAFSVIVAFGGESAQGLAWRSLQVCGLVAALITYMVLRLRPTGRELAVSVLLGALVWLAYLPTIISTTQVLGFTATAAATVAFLLAARAHPEAIPGLVKRHALVGVAIGIGVGLTLGAINLWLATSSGTQPDPGVTWRHFVVILSPAVMEEVAARAVFLALAVAALRGRPQTRRSSLLVWLLMLLPHTIVHTVGMWQSGNPAGAIIQLVILAILFGLPFAILQRRRDLLSAMVAHGTVDLVRFTVLGLPV